MPFGPFLASIAFGFVKGLTAGADDEPAFSVEHDFMGPVKEELMYRGAPLWLKPNLPMGSTAVLFAADHLISDHKQAMKNGTGTPSTGQVIARFGDTFFGGVMYEMAFREYGILGAIGAHVLHNVANGIGTKVRR